MEKVYKVAKVNFDLISTDYNASDVVYFRDYHKKKNLKVGQSVWVSLGNKKIIGTFLGYEDINIETKRTIVRKVKQSELEAFYLSVENNLLECPLKVTDEVLDFYRSNFKGNQDVTKEQATLRLTRNFLMGYRKRITGDGVISCQYGFQQLRVKGHTVVEISTLNRSPKFIKEWDRYQYLNDKLGIELTIDDKIKYGLAV